MSAFSQPPGNPRSAHRPVRIFLCGDVMTGRGIDQILPRPCDPVLHESYVTSALHYVQLAEEAHGPLPRRVARGYVWGAALGELKRSPTDARIINLETSITRSPAFEPKGINYRMSPENARCLSAAGVDCCVLANNHVLDWGHAGLLDTLANLNRLDIAFAGAGRDLAQAAGPAIVDVGGQVRIVVFGFGSVTSGVPRSWAATHERAGINLLADYSDASIARVAERIRQARRPGDVIVVSIHWGPNWGYHVPDDQIRFAHALLEAAPISIIHGHSSHHPKAIEVHGNRLILYGCGDFLNDYEGIEGYEAFRDDLALMYFADIDPTSADILAVEMVPLQIRRFQLAHASPADIDWLHRTLDRESRRFGARVELAPDGRFALRWDRSESRGGFLRSRGESSSGP
ncbi:MAG TPA: CapA family protein [Xanthobacteraceae bacterium]|jgi:poly-gamma-glutamate synthesis protein (capsule biosynthesis protein)